MEKALNIAEILDSAVKDISKKVAKLDMNNIAPTEIINENSSSLFATTTGDYTLTVEFHTSNQLFLRITQNMKRSGPPGDSDIQIYTTEFFNVLFGRIVSAVNNQLKARTRFAIPVLISGSYLKERPKPYEHQQIAYYSCEYGPVKIELRYCPCNKANAVYTNQ